MVAAFLSPFTCILQDGAETNISPEPIGAAFPLPDRRPPSISLFTIFANGQAFLPQQVSEAVGAVAREHLAVDRAFGMHYDVLPWSRVVDSARPPKYD